MNYKRYTAFLFALLLLSACGEPEADSNADADSKPVQEKPKKDNNTSSGEKKEARKNDVVGWYETDLLDAGKPRITNITLAMRKIDGKVLKPDEEFSFNTTVGRRTSSRGYKKATIFKKSQEVKEVGGGICQLSSTMYCAVKQAGLKITERHEHQLPVDYVKKGDDATVYYGRLDFRFVNSLDTAVKITCGIKDRKVQVGITALYS